MMQTFVFVVLMMVLVMLLLQDGNAFPLMLRTTRVRYGPPQQQQQQQTTLPRSKDSSNARILGRPMSTTMTATLRL